MLYRGVVAVLGLALLGCAPTRPDDMASLVTQRKQQHQLKQQEERLALLDGRLRATATLLEELQWNLEARLQGNDEPEVLPPRLQLPVEPAPAPAPDWTPNERELAEAYETRLFAPVVAEKPPESKDSGWLHRRLPLSRFLATDGSVLDLVTYRGEKKLVLVLLRGFAGQICLNCSVQTRALARTVEDFRSRGAEVVLVYPGEARSVPQFLEAVSDLGPDFELPFPILLDVDLTFVRALRLESDLAKPSSFILDVDGVIRYAYVGSNPTDRPSVPDLLSALDAVGD